MRTAVDTSVLLDVITEDPGFADRSEAALRKATAAGSLCICECVMAELRPALAADVLDELLADWGIDFAQSTRQSAMLAGEMFGAYLQRRRRSRPRVVADFLIGAHAFVHADRLLARDRGYYRDYFAGLVLMEP